MSDVQAIKDQNDSLHSQLEAHKGMLNEQLQSNVMLRTQLVGMHKEFQKLNVQIVDLNKQIVDLTPKPAEEVAA